MEDRKARLAALAARAGRGAGGGVGGAATDSKEDVAAVGASTSAPIQDGADDSNEGQDQEQTRDAIEQKPFSSPSTEKAPPPALKFRNYSAAPATSGSEGGESGLPATKKARRTATSGNDSKPSIGASSSSSNNKPPKSALELALEKAAMATASSLPSAMAGATIAAADGADGDLGAAVAALAPKKINWDLKRDVQPKLDKLERRTQRAIVQLLQERLGRDADANVSSSNNGAAGVEELD